LKAWVYKCVGESPLIPSKINPVHAFSTLFLKIHIIIIQLSTGSQNGILPSGFSTKTKNTAGKNGIFSPLIF